MTRRLTYAPLIMLALTLTILYFPLLRGEVFYWGLPTLQFYPWRHLAADLLRDGLLPLWNPFNGAGTPLLANYQSALLYPPNWVTLVLPLEWSMSVIAVVHLWIAGWGMWRLTGRLGVSPLGRGVSVFAFALTNYLVARLFTFPIITAAAWLPWLAWAALGVLATGKRRQAAWLALFAAMQLLAGHAQTTWYSLTLVGVLALWWTAAALRQPRERGAALVRLIGVGAALALGAGIAALQLAPTAELLAQSQRGGGVDAAFAMNYSYAPARALNWLSPFPFGTPADGSYFTQGAYFEDAVYIGVIPLIGAFAALSAWARRRTGGEPVYKSVPFWLIIVIVGFAFALGAHTPIFPFLYEHVPTFDMFQAPVRWHLWTVFGLSILAGIGVSAWGRGRPTRRWARRALVGAVGAFALLLIGAFALQIESEPLRILMRAMIGLVAFIGAAAVLTLTQPGGESPRYGRWMIAVLTVIAVDVGIASWGLNPTVTPQVWAAERGEPRADVDDGLAYWFPDDEEAVKFACMFRFDDYRAGFTACGQPLTWLPNANIFERQRLYNNFEPLLVGHFARYSLLLSEGGTSALRAAANITSLRSASEGASSTMTSGRRAWLVESLCWHATPEALEAALRDPNWDVRAQAHGLGDGDCPAGAPINADVRLTDAFNTVTIAVNAERGGWLILADTDYPGWKATLDGESIPIYRANLMFRAVQVEAGAHEVVFRYEPDWLTPAFVLSALSLIVLVFLFAWTDKSNGEYAPRTASPT